MYIVIVYQFISGSLNYLFVSPSSHSSIRSFFYRVLSSTEVLSTDEESSDTGGESEDELSRNLESLLSSKKTALDLTHEQEEAERQELRRLLMEDQPVSLSLSLSFSHTHTHTHTHTCKQFTFYSFQISSKSSSDTHEHSDRGM